MTSSSARSTARESALEARTAESSPATVTVSPSTTRWSRLSERCAIRASWSSPTCRHASSSAASLISSPSRSAIVRPGGTDSATMALSRSVGATHSTVGIRTPARSAIVVFRRELRSAHPWLDRHALLVDVAHSYRSQHSREEFEVTVVLVEVDHLDGDAIRTSTIRTEMTTRVLVAQFVDLEAGSGELRRAGLPSPDVVAVTRTPRARPSRRRCRRRA